MGDGLTADSLRFDLTGWSPLPSEASPGMHGIEERRWEGADGDLLTLLFYPRPDPLPLDPQRVAEVRDFGRQMAVSNGAGLIEASPLRVLGVTGVRVISKHPLEPVGFAFVGNVSFHVGGSAYALSVECHERGMTGARETAVAMALDVDINPGFFKRLLGKDDWFADPYDPGIRTDVMRCRADDEEWDAKFPDHPLSRVRRHLARLQETFTLPDE